VVVGVDVTGGVLTGGLSSGIGTESEVTVGRGSTAAPSAGSAATTGAGSIADRMPNQDRPTATAVTTAHAARYPIDRLTATTLL
jgi:hypothetical protein